MKTSTRTPNSLPSPLRNLACAAALLQTFAAPGQGVSIVPISIPGASSVVPCALDNAGHIAGTYYDAGQAQRAFLWNSGGALDLGHFGGGVSAALSMNNAGAIVGSSATGNEGEFRAFLFTNGVLGNLGGLGGFSSSAEVVNDAGQIAGDSFLDDGVSSHAFLYSRGVMADLGTLGGRSSYPTAMNNAGQVVGNSRLPGNRQTHAFLYSGGVMTDLGTLGGSSSFATAINDAGLIAGRATTTDGNTHAYLHNGITMLDLGTLGGVFSSAFAMNHAGHVIGSSTLAGEDQSHAFVFSNGTMNDLGTLGGDSATPRALNNAGQIVGFSTDASGYYRAFLWQNGVMVDLNSLLPAGSGWDLTDASHLNDVGQIVGEGTYLGQPAAFLLALPAGENQPPVANAGPDQTVEANSETTPVLLNGSGSSDPNGNPLTFDWLAGGNSLGTSVQLTLGLGLGSYTFTLRVSDGNGGTAEDSVVINVVDSTPPVLPCPASRTTSADRHGAAVIPDFLAGLSLSDNVTPAAAIVVRQSPASGTVVGCGTNTITLTATDAAGNQSVCRSSFVVLDVTPPRVRCLGEITRRANTNCQAFVTDLSERLHARDNCTPADQLIITQSPAPGTLLGLGRHELRVTVADAAGNRTNCVVVFHVVDRSPPRITSLQANPEFLRDADGAMVPVTLSVVARDNCDPHPISRIVSVKRDGSHRRHGNDSEPDWIITGNLTLTLRAERNAHDRRRVYTIKVECKDAAGNTSTRCVSVPVRRALAGEPQGAAPAPGGE